ncbi:hypothetical protein [Virgibacillus halophilus]
MIRQWNFIINNKLITVHAKNLKGAQKKAQQIYNDLQKEAV